MSDKPRIFGTKEWATYNHNCVTGCSHDCLYCYARYNAAIRFKNVKLDEWGTEIVDMKSVVKTFKKRSGITMFPTQHDITPKILDVCLQTLHNLLKPGNSVLVVSKPHLECVKVLCDELQAYKGQILYRFTIGALDDSILQYWEHGAPKAQERIDSLKYAFDAGFSTSISMEPCLDWDRVIQNFDMLAPYVTNSIWIGAMNDIEKRVQINTDEDRKHVEQMKAWQNVDTYRKVYNVLKDHPLIKWKESIKTALGLEMPIEIGQDV